MKKFVFVLWFVLLLPSVTSVASSPPLWRASDIANLIEMSEFTFVDRMRLHGYWSTESCVYVSEAVVVVEHYCYPVRNYPARALSLWSREIGLVHLYEEDQGSSIKRDFEQTEFPGYLDNFLPIDLLTVRAETINSIMEKLEFREHPACWATNHDWYSNGMPSADCYRFAFSELPNWWASENLSLTEDRGAWNTFYDRILDKIRPEFIE